MGPPNPRIYPWFPPRQWEGPAVDRGGNVGRRTVPCESRHFMAETMEAAFASLDAAQATELAVLVELEACWENLRKTPLGAKAVGHGTQDLLGIQKAYDAFHSKLVAYNGRYTPAYAPELL